MNRDRICDLQWHESCGAWSVVEAQVTDDPKMTSNEHKCVLCGCVHGRRRKFICIASLSPDSSRSSTTWPCLFGDLSTAIAFALLDAAIVMSDGYRHVADDVEPNYRGTTVFRSYRCVSLDVPFNADDGRHAYRYNNKRLT
eukprot:scaffold4647_cov80-Skeletonema_marinoi.AAC.1